MTATRAVGLLPKVSGKGDGLWGEVLAIRWNGSAGAEIGNPQSRGLATWFIVPEELEQTVRDAIANLANARCPS